MNLFRCVVSIGIAMATGCGGGSSSPTPVPTPTPTPTPSPATRMVFSMHTFTNLPRGAAFRQEADLVPLGILDGVVDWGSPMNDVNVYITPTSCASVLDLLAGRCMVLAQTTSPTAKPERLSFNNTVRDTYFFWIVNQGPGTESGTLEIGLTR